MYVHVILIIDLIFLWEEGVLCRRRMGKPLCSGFCFCGVILLYFLSSSSSFVQWETNRGNQCLKPNCFSNILVSCSQIMPMPTLAVYLSILFFVRMQAFLSLLHQPMALARLVFSPFFWCALNLTKNIGVQRYISLPACCH